MRPGIGGIDKIDRPASIEPPHQRNLASAERAPTVMPDDQPGCSNATFGHSHGRRSVQRERKEAKVPHHGDKCGKRDLPRSEVTGHGEYPLSFFT
jgi:hypothetical protein